MGDSGSGKSTLVKKFINSYALHETKSTEDGKYSSIFKLDNGRAFGLSLLDTVDNQESFEELPDMLDSDVILLTYCIDQDASYNNLFLRCSALQKHIKHDQPHPRILIVGTKADLETTRQVPQGSGRKLANAFNLDGYIECSAFTGNNVYETFKMASELAIKKREEDGEPATSEESFNSVNIEHNDRRNKDQVPIKKESNKCCIIM